jgi:hypothetical protein
VEEVQGIGFLVGRGEVFFFEEVVDSISIGTCSAVDWWRWWWSLRLWVGWCWRL